MCGLSEIYQLTRPPITVYIPQLVGPHRVLIRALVYGIRPRLGIRHAILSRLKVVLPIRFPLHVQSPVRSSRVQICPIRPSRSPLAVVHIVLLVGADCNMNVWSFALENVFHATPLVSSLSVLGPDIVVVRLFDLSQLPILNPVAWQKAWDRRDVFSRPVSDWGVV
jgi:hypothetical protein